MVTNCGSVQCVCVAILCALACDSRRRGVPVPSPQQDAQPAKHLEASDNLAADAQSKFAPDAAPDATGAGKPVGKIDTESQSARCQVDADCNLFTSDHCCTETSGCFWRADTEAGIATYRATAECVTHVCHPAQFCTKPRAELQCREQRCKVVREAAIVPSAQPGMCVKDTDCAFVASNSCVSGDNVCEVKSVSTVGTKANHTGQGRCGGVRYSGPCEMPRDAHPVCVFGTCGVAAGPGGWVTNACSKNSDCAIYRNCPVCRTDGKCEYGARSVAAQTEYKRLHNATCLVSCGELGMCHLPIEVHAECSAGVCVEVHSAP